MTGIEIRAKYLVFMEKNGHAVVPSSALVPENDPTTLFTGSGMQPLVPYLMGETHPKGTRITNSQKCFRAEDIEEVGDSSHTTFFEMLGNWSLGDYFKSEQINWIAQFYLDEIGLDPTKFYVTAFIGDEAAGVPKDIEAVELWQDILAKRGISNAVAEMGSADEASTRGMRDGERIFYYDAKENWWSRAGIPANMPVGEIGGGDSEMFYDFGTEHDTKFGEHCHPACDCGRFMEIGNSVFMEYIKTETGFEALPAKNIDFGGGLERIAAASINSPDVYKVDLLWTVIEQIQELSDKKYEDNLEAFRVITDHIRGAVFMIGDGVLPSNTEQGYFVRRLLRRAVRFADMIEVPAGEFANLAKSVINSYAAHYTNLKEQEADIIAAISGEEAQFRKTLENGLKQFNKISLQVHVSREEIAKAKETGEKLQTTGVKSISAQNAFDLFTTYGFPIELTVEIAQEKGLVVDTKGFEKLMVEHRALSRAGAEQKFKGGLADSSEIVVQYHTATHLLLAALRELVGEHVHQAGSNITGERMRFDFTHTEKVERDMLDKIEAWVNNAIETGGVVTIDMMAKTVAEADATIEASFWDRYPDEVKVYSMTGTDGTIYSRELCGGPHVENFTEFAGKTFKIKKEESSSAGVRRIKAVLLEN
ncbi:MAG: alanyl-tRNA synthetase [Candidatus Paceibacteria bacterium]|jgi:alanyl-tRNA synthetase